MKLVQELSLQHLTNIVWAFASLHWTVPGLMPALVAGALPRSVFLALLWLKTVPPPLLLLWLKTVPLLLLLLGLGAV